MRHDTIWSVRSQLQGCYMPDNIQLYSSRREALSALAEIRRESIDAGCDTAIDHGQWRSYLFVREEWQEVQREHDTYPYMHVVEPVSWREIAGYAGVTTRRKVLEQES